MSSSPSTSPSPAALDPTPRGEAPASPPFSLALRSDMPSCALAAHHALPDHRCSAPLALTPLPRRTPQPLSRPAAPLHARAHPQPHAAAPPPACSPPCRAWPPAPRRA
nr:classical arabinogalactan protein 9-like [Aegilops tauschii subsp. strangulata]